MAGAQLTGAAWCAPEIFLNTSNYGAFVRWPPKSPARSIIHEPRARANNDFASILSETLYHEPLTTNIRGVKITPLEVRHKPELNTRLDADT